MKKYLKVSVSLYEPSPEMWYVGRYIEGGWNVQERERERERSDGEGLTVTTSRQLPPRF